MAAAVVALEPLVAVAPREPVAPVLAQAVLPALLPRVPGHLVLGHSLAVLLAALLVQLPVPADLLHAVVAAVSVAVELLLSRPSF